MTTLIPKLLPHGLLSYITDISVLLAIQVTADRYFPEYFKYSTLAILTPLISIRYSASPIDELNQKHSQRRHDQPPEAELQELLEDACNKSCAKVGRYMLEHEITSNLTIMVIMLIFTAGVAAQPYTSQASADYLNFNDVNSMQWTLLVLASLKFLCDSLTLRTFVKGNNKELKFEATYEALHSVLIVSAAACILFSSNETVKLSALLAETLLALSIVRNDCKIINQTVHFLADKTKTWASFYKEADDNDLDTPLVRAGVNNA